jgi:UDP-glucose 4-epimerase
MSPKRKILVTGSGGFIGGRLAARLTELGHDVRGYDITEGKDLLDLGQLEEAIQGVDVVFHIAAQADLTQMASDIEKARAGVMANVEATHNVAYLCAKHHKWLVHASTACAYGQSKQHPSKEDETIPNPGEIYGASKVAAEWVVRGYGLSHNLRWTILRFATIYGEGIREALAVSVFFRQAIKGEPITVHGDGKQDRAQTYVGDLVEGIVTTLEHEDEVQSQVINLANDQGITALAMAQDIKRITGSDSVIKHVPQRANNTLHEELDVSKASRLLQWRAQTTWEEGLQRTLAWIKKDIHTRKSASTKPSNDNNDEDVVRIRPTEEAKSDLPLGAPAPTL